MEEPGHSKFMQRCLDLALKAEGMTYPNPMVGAVIVHNNRIVGEGYHMKAGAAHAEVNAINSVKDKSVLRQSTMYVSLEPCSHFGKTPPCADLIVSCGIPEIVVGTEDTSDKVAGKGIKILQSSGCRVITGILGDKCRWINRRFFTWHEKKRPYVILKWAQSADGYLDVIRESDTPLEPNWISGKPERILVHRWRATEQAILVGGETIRKDNPGLNVRDWPGRDPLRLILSRSGNVSTYLDSDRTNGTVIVFTENDNLIEGPALKVLLNRRYPAARQILDYLCKEGIQSLFIEGGALVLNHFIENGLWDEARVITGNSEFRNGIAAPMLAGTKKSYYSFETTRLQITYNDDMLNLVS